MMRKNKNNGETSTMRRRIILLMAIIIFIILLFKGCELLRDSQPEAELPKIEISNAEEEVSEDGENDKKEEKQERASQKKNAKRVDDEQSNSRGVTNSSDLIKQLWKPSDQTKPNDLTNPSEPTNPSNPEKPSDSTNPSEPMSPSNPEKPSEPTEPSNPEKPSEPTNPEKRNLKSEDIIVMLPENLEETGQAKEVIVTLLNGVTADISVAYEGNTTDGEAVNAGNYVAVVAVTGTGDYQGVVVKRISFEITKKPVIPEKKELKETDVDISLPENLEETGQAKEVIVTLLNGVTADISVAYEGNTTDGKAVNAGNYVAVVTATGTGDYKGVVVKRISFEITKKPVIPEKKELKETDVDISLPEDLTVSGRPKEVIVTLLNGVTADISVTYEGNTTDGKAVNAGNYVAIVTATGTGDYQGVVTKTVNFTLWDEDDPNNPSQGNPDKEPEDPGQGNPDSDKDPDGSENGENNPDDENNIGSKDGDGDETGENNPDDENNIGSKDGDGDETGGNNPDDENNIGSQEGDGNETDGNNSDDENNQGASEQQMQAELFFSVVEQEPAEPKSVSNPEPVLVPAPIEEKKEDEQSSSPRTVPEPIAELPKQQQGTEVLPQQNDAE